MKTEITTKPNTDSRDFKDIAAKNDDNSPTFDVIKKNGNVKLTVSNYFEDWITDVLSEGEVDMLVHRFKKQEGDNKIIFVIQPKKKCIIQLFQRFSKMEQEMELAANGIDPAHDIDLEDTLKQKDIYTEEQDIADSNSRYGYREFQHDNPVNYS